MKNTKMNDLMRLLNAVNPEDISKDFSAFNRIDVTIDRANKSSDAGLIHIMRFEWWLLDNATGIEEIDKFTTDYWVGDIQVHVVHK